MFQARVLISKLRCQYHEAQILAPYLSIIMYFLNVDVIAPDQVASLPDKVLTRLGISPFCLPPTFHPSPLFSPLGSFAHLLLVQPSYISSSDRAIVLRLRIFTCWQLRPREELIMRIIAAKISISTTLYNLWCYIHQRRHFFSSFQGLYEICNGYLRRPG